MEKNKAGLRRGWTTGTCAQAAAAAAAQALLAGSLPREGADWTVTVHLPNGQPFTLPVQSGKIEKRDSQGRPLAVTCKVKKDSGDDPDVTDGVTVCATVSFFSEDRIEIDGGQGVGRVTKPGLAQPVGSAAINPVPRQMIQKELVRLKEAAGWEGGFQVLVEIPGGEQLAQRTFNPRIGIVGGLSVLGTSGIVEPMSEKALIDTIEVEIKVKLAEGRRCLIAAPGNYGLDFLRDRWGILARDTVKCSNYIGETIDLAAEHGAEGLLFVGHIGKLVKIAGGIMNTHSRWGDCRMELLASSALRAGLSGERAAALLCCNTTEDALQILTEKERRKVLDCLLEKIHTHLNIRAQSSAQRDMKTGAVLFSNVYGVLGMTRYGEELLARGREK
ncbi:cobalamin biosynthesis protein CbiD [Lachnospiraceae bacterium DSM 108991]|uniref:Cobalt-precorrin-5B C(1)-methyltransferase n=2 Tax=Claveliimonas monacensis TaxID=2779351 RepID=A0ABR9RH87_9FIRM|nr:cobalamin biosynthesis protein CbiD [Claveliimonas monacensis]